MIARKGAKNNPIFPEFQPHMTETLISIFFIMIALIASFFMVLFIFLIFFYLIAYNLSGLNHLPWNPVHPFSGQFSKLPWGAVVLAVIFTPLFIAVRLPEKKEPDSANLQ